jgi:hypothetical protein
MGFLKDYRSTERRADETAITPRLLKPVVQIRCRHRHQSSDNI